MRRTFRIDPDRQLPDGTLIVSSEAIQRGMQEAGVIAARLGGTIATIQNRIPTGEEGEMLTTEFVVFYRDKTRTKAAPEVANELESLRQASPGAFEDEPDPQEQDEAIAAVAGSEAELAAVGANGSAEEPEFDEDSIPAGLREG